jgi:hypothetical protein
MSKDTNYGLSTPRVRILEQLPKVVRKPQSFNFDINAFQWNAINNSPFLSPLLTENVINPEKTFAFCYPSKRKFFVNNLLKHSTGPVKSFPLPTPAPEPATLPDRTIFWTPVGPPPPSGRSSLKSKSKVSSLGTITDVLEENKVPSYYESIPTTDPDSRKPLIDKPPAKATVDEYNGPKWINRTYKEQAQPDDRKIIKRWFNFIEKGFTKKKKLKPLPTKPLPENSIRTSVYQERIEDGLWWGIESSDFLEENMPFWVTLELPKDPPTPSQYETLYIISLGISSTSNQDRYDLLISRTRKPTLIDYYGISGGGEGDANIREFDVDSSRIGFNDSQIDVGFMTAGGRLIIFVNDAQLVYTRIKKTGHKDNVGTLKEAKITKGAIRVYGTNTSANIYAYPMTFAEKSAMIFPISSIKEVDVVDEPSIVTEIEYSAADEENKPTGKPVATLPRNYSVKAASSKMYGVDARQFSDVNGPPMNLTPSFGLHLNGFVEFFSAASIPKVPKKPIDKVSDFFILIMTPETKTWLGENLPYSEPPYFFQLKGVDEQDRSAKKQVIIDATPDVMTIKEDTSAPDYHHIKKSASITLYNEGGTYDFLKDKQHGVQIDWSWNGKNRTQTFTGIITSNNTSESPGKEIMTIQCEDYNQILKSTPIINSPFYDGMVAFYVAKDLAQRAGIQEFEKEWEPTEREFFLPSGYSFSSPKMRFPSTNMIFDCIINIVKRFEAFIYFDGAGVMHIDKLPGGLLGPPPDTVTPTKKFSSDPSSLDEKILDQKDISIDFSRTVNKINLMTLERDTRNIIMLGKIAGEKDKLAFKREVLIDQPAYGEKEVAKVHMDEMAKRIFNTIRKTSFKTVGSNTVLSPLDFITVDGIAFRLISISRSFNAENNDYVNEYEAEWLNG